MTSIPNFIVVVLFSSLAFGLASPSGGTSNSHRSSTGVRDIGRVSHTKVASPVINHKACNSLDDDCEQIKLFDLFGFTFMVQETFDAATFVEPVNRGQSIAPIFRTDFTSSENLGYVQKELFRQLGGRKFRSSLPGALYGISVATGCFSLRALNSSSWFKLSAVSTCSDLNLMDVEHPSMEYSDLSSDSLRVLDLADICDVENSKDQNSDEQFATSMLGCLNIPYFKTDVDHYIQKSGYSYFMDLIHKTMGAVGINVVFDETSFIELSIDDFFEFSEFLWTSALIAISDLKWLCFFSLFKCLWVVVMFWRGVERGPLFWVPYLLLSYTLLNSSYWLIFVLFSGRYFIFEDNFLGHDLAIELFQFLASVGILMMFGSEIWAINFVGVVLFVAILLTLTVLLFVLGNGNETKYMYSVFYLCGLCKYQMELIGFHELNFFMSNACEWFSLVLGMTNESGWYMKEVFFRTEELITNTGIKMNGSDKLMIVLMLGTTILGFWFAVRITIGHCALAGVKCKTQTRVELAQQLVLFSFSNMFGCLTIFTFFWKPLRPEYVKRFAFNLLSFYLFIVTACRAYDLLIVYVICSIITIKRGMFYDFCTIRNLSFDNVEIRVSSKRGKLNLPLIDCDAVNRIKRATFRTKSSLSSNEVGAIAIVIQKDDVATIETTMSAIQGGECTLTLINDEHGERDLSICVDKFSCTIDDSNPEIAQIVTRSLVSNAMSPVRNFNPGDEITHVCCSTAEKFIITEDFDVGNNGIVGIAAEFKNDDLGTPVFGCTKTGDIVHFGPLLGGPMGRYKNRAAIRGWNPSNHGIIAAPIRSRRIAFCPGRFDVPVQFRCDDLEPERDKHPFAEADEVLVDRIRHISQGPVQHPAKGELIQPWVDNFFGTYLSAHAINCQNLRKQLDMKKLSMEDIKSYGPSKWTYMLLKPMLFAIKVVDASTRERIATSSDPNEMRAAIVGSYIRLKNLLDD